MTYAPHRSNSPWLLRATILTPGFVGPWLVNSEHAFEVVLDQLSAPGQRVGRRRARPRDVHGRGRLPDFHDTISALQHKPPVAIGTLTMTVRWQGGGKL
jgi:hypothetical protein